MKQTIAPQDIKTCYPHQYSYIDRSGRVVIDAGKYQRVGSFSEGLAPVWLVNEGWGFINKSGKFAIEPQFEQAYGFSEGLAGIRVGGLWGFIDRTGRLVIEPQYERVNPFSEGIAVVVKAAPRPASRLPAQGRTLQVKSIEIEVVTLIGMHAEDGSADYPAGHGSKEVLLIDQTGQAALSFSHNRDELQLVIYENARFSEGLIGVYDGSKKKYGFMDQTGKVVIEPKYEEAAPFSEGLARVGVVADGEEKLGFIDRSGQFVIPPRFNTDADFRRNSTDFSEGLASLTEGLRPTLTDEAKFVYIDQKGAIVLFTDFFYAGPFRDGMAAVYDDEKNRWGLINKSGEVVIPIQYDSVHEFSEGLAYVAMLGT